jgi:hypothetical protein
MTEKRESGLHHRKRVMRKRKEEGDGREENR